MCFIKLKYYLHGHIDTWTSLCVRESDTIRMTAWNFTWIAASVVNQCSYHSSTHGMN